MLEDQSVLRVPPTLSTPDSLKREMLLVELMEHFIPSSWVSSFTETERRERRGWKKVKERRWKRRERGEEGGEGRERRETCLRQHRVRWSSYSNVHLYKQHLFVSTCTQFLPSWLKWWWWWWWWNIPHSPYFTGPAKVSNIRASLQLHRVDIIGCF